MADFLDYEVATVSVAGFPIPVTGLSPGVVDGGPVSVFVAPGVALQVPADEVNASGFTARQFLENCRSHAALRVVTDDRALAASMTVFDLVAVLHFCLALKRESDAQVRRAIRVLLDARNDLIEQVRAGQG